MCLRVLKRSFLRVAKRSFLRVAKRPPDRKNIWMHAKLKIYDIFIPIYIHCILWLFIFHHPQNNRFLTTKTSLSWPMSPCSSVQDVGRVCFAGLFLRSVSPKSSIPLFLQVGQVKKIYMYVYRHKIDIIYFSHTFWKKKIS